MAEDVIESMVSLKLTSEEEENIQVSDEGRMDEIDSCALSLIGKFLTCKPFNRKAVKNMLRQAWGLDKELQISEVGNRIGAVEDVERRRCIDDHNFFLRFRVALPISKPLRRGGFLLGSDGKCLWVKYKYERMPIFCHYCGVLGHDLCHCSTHFVVLKKATSIDYQYGD
ncbi:hypothetical protein CFP56_011093 [Quercus suber]|uniref:Zinc knuckle CX2CX4HX4C domain-containing protein n=1 Tax=Quercus suber TaxID=58331 RepID=A0AAW0KZ89_QUESU